MTKSFANRKALVLLGIVVLCGRGSNLFCSDEIPEDKKQAEDLKVYLGNYASVVQKIYGPPDRINKPARTAIKKGLRSNKEWWHYNKRGLVLFFDRGELVKILAKKSIRGISKALL